MAAIELERLRGEFAKAAKRLKSANRRRGRATNGASVDVLRTSEFEQARGAYFAARSTFAERNLRLVYHVAKRYLTAGLSRDDLISEGTLGLMIAIDRHDFRRGRFATYATFWIRAFIFEAIAKRTVVSLPRNDFSKRGRIDGSYSKYLTRFGSAPTIREIEQDTRLHAREIERLIEAGVLKHHMIPLSTPLRYSDLCYADILPSSEPTPEERVEKLDASKVVSQLLHVLDATEREVIKRRFDDDLTFRQIGERIGRSHETVRQIQESAIAKMAGAARAEFGAECGQ